MHSLKIFVFLAFIGIMMVSDAAEPSVPHSPFDGKRVMFLGDSITRAGIYFRYIDYYLQKSFPADKIDIIGLGLGSETTTGKSEKQHPWPRPNVHERLGRALEMVKPDIVCICYGMNDGLYHPFSEERFSDYQKGIVSVIEKVKATGAKVIVMTPPPFDPQSVPKKKKLLDEGAADYGFRTPFKNYNDVLTKYGQWIMQLDIPDVTTVDIHTPMQKHVTEMRKVDPEYTISHDGIHPNPLGHLLMARLFLRSLNLLDDKKSLAEAEALRKKDRMCGWVAKRTAFRANGWLEYVGYTRAKKTVKSDSIEEVKKKAAEMQKDIDKLKNQLQNSR